MLSIIIPTYNEEKYLPMLLRSIRRQSYRDLEIIVADAGSRDNTLAVAKEYGAKVVSGGMPGVGRNAGAKAARGNIFLFLDADVVLQDNDFIHSCLAEFHRRKLELATCEVRPLSLKTIDRFFHGVYNVYIKTMNFFSPHAPGFCIFSKKTTHELISGFDESVIFCEDKDYVRRAVKLGVNFKILKSKKINVSVRRFDRDGRWTVAGRYLFAEAYQIFKGSVRKELFPYVFGNYEETRSKNQEARKS